MVPQKEEGSEDMPYHDKILHSIVCTELMDPPQLIRSSNNLQNSKNARVSFLVTCMSEKQLTQSYIHTKGTTDTIHKQPNKKIYKLENKDDATENQHDSQMKNCRQFKIRVSKQG